jgi:hypothetical protein
MQDTPGLYLVCFQSAFYRLFVTQGVGGGKKIVQVLHVVPHQPICACVLQGQQWQWLLQPFLQIPIISMFTDGEDEQLSAPPLAFLAPKASLGLTSHYGTNADQLVKPIGVFMTGEVSQVVRNFCTSQ